MKITFFVPNYQPSIGGAQLHVQRVAEGLVERHGHEVRVVTTDALFAPGSREPGRVPGPHEEVIGGVVVQRVPFARRTHSLVRSVRRVRGRLGILKPRTSTRLAVGPLGFRLAATAFRAGRENDAVVGVASPFLTLMAADLASRRGPAAHIAMPLLHLGIGLPPKWVLRSVLRAEGVTCSTTFERDWLTEHGVDRARTALLPPGCDPDGYVQTPASEARRNLDLPERRTVGYIGRIAANKGVDTFAKAAEELWQTHPETTVLLVGRPAGWTEFDRLRDRLREVGGGRFVEREHFEESDRSDIFSACDVIAFPSRQESFGMITIEAWCASRPVVAADIGAVRCVIRPGVDGELVAVGDASGLAGEIGSLLDDPDRRERYGTAGRRRAETEFTWELIIDRWNDFLVDSVARRGPGRRVLSNRSGAN